MKLYQKTNLTIKNWAEADRPREKLLLKGRHSLSDAELIAILIGSGTKDESAVAVAQRILNSVNGALDELSRKTIQSLTKFKGIGDAKAIIIAAALELGRRRQLTDIRERPLIQSSRDVYQLVAPLLFDLTHEEFWMLTLNRANRVMSREQISIGGMAGTVVDAKIIFRKALEAQASSVILCHNHPSGSLKPSQQDVEITKKLKTAGEAIEISVFDHLIVTEKGYFSFADEGLI